MPHFSRLLAAGVTIALLQGCVTHADDVTLDSRLSMIETTAPGLDEPVTIYWNDYQVPYIVAVTDTDLAFALGVVQGHLREAQMQLLKRVAQGRLSEMFGPLTTEIDEALRILGFDYAAPAMRARLPEETADWLDAYVAGLNHNQRHSPPPPEAAWLALEPEPWTVDDILTIGRLAGTDVGWLIYFSMLYARDDEDFEETWARILEVGTNGTTSFDATPAQQALSDILTGTSKSGSNSLVVAPELSATGHAWMANDPHLGLILPNLWVIVGVKSPSYHAVGFMLPGLPFLGLGRNPDLAWGGTNMRAAASDLFDVSQVPESDIAARTDTIGTRFWFDTDITIRRTPWGPIISDAEVLPGENIAVRWMGHKPSDEISAFLGAMRATDAESFRDAFASYAVSGQNMLFATKDGDIGQFPAVRVPRREEVPETLVRQIENADEDWRNFVGTLDLPWSLNPSEGFLASANNRPTTPTAAPLGYFFADDDRIGRLQQMVRERAPIDREDLIAIQTDVTSIFAADLASELLARFDASGLNGPILDDFRGWDGAYLADARAPLAFELVLSSLATRLYGNEEGEVPGAKEEWGYLHAYLLEDFQALPESEQRAMLDNALSEATTLIEDYEVWGDFHRMRVGHALANVPVIGPYFFELFDYPVGGSRATPMKTNHDLETERHTTNYGSMSRHISDMGDPDANWFVLFGGQDGWWGSANFADQMQLWRDGEFIRMPLDLDLVRDEFPLQTVLEPAEPAISDVTATSD